MFLLTLPLLLGSCQKHEAGHVETSTIVIDTTQMASTQDMEMQLALERGIVLERVKSIFKLVSEDQRSLSGFVTSGLCDKMFCSKSWNELIMAVQRKEFHTSSLFHEIDYWTMTRDPELVSFDEFEVTDLVIDDKKTATVSFTVYEMSTYIPARVDLVFEDGRWVIDNFYDMRYLLNLRHCMWNYLNNGSDYI